MIRTSTDELNRREFLGTAGAAAVGLALVAKPRGEDATNSPTRRPAKPPFVTRGIYFHDGFTVEPKSHAPLYWDRETWQHEIRWLHASGINAIEFATMLEFSRHPSTDLERRKISDRLHVLDYAHSLGVQFGYQLSNTVLSTVPTGEEPGDQLNNRAVTLCPRQPGNFEKTLGIQRHYLETYRHSDFFEEMAADWGGCTCGQCGVPEYLRYVRELAEKLAEVHPGARMYANTWSISLWGKPNWGTNPDNGGWREMFDREIKGSQKVIAALPSLPANVHVALPCHHLYRALAFTLYGGKTKTPRFPTPEDVQHVRRAGREVLAWPHFVMDDDAYRGRSWGIVHSEVRYIQALLRTLQGIGIDRVMGNLYLPLLQLPNTFAYGRLLQGPDREPQSILHDFARLVAQRDDVAKLTEVLLWVENNSYWQQQMPLDGRLPNLPCKLTRETALKLASEVKPNPVPELYLPTAAGAWLGDLHHSIERMSWAV
jgi:hypothetical protein